MITTTTAVPTARVGMDFTLVLAMAVEEQAGNQTEKAGITAMPGGLGGLAVPCKATC